MTTTAPNVLIGLPYSEDGALAHAAQAIGASVLISTGSLYRAKAGKNRQGFQRIGLAAWKAPQAVAELEADAQDQAEDQAAQEPDRASDGLEAAPWHHGLDETDDEGRIVKFKGHRYRWTEAEGFTPLDGGPPFPHAAPEPKGTGDHGELPAELPTPSTTTSRPPRDPSSPHHHLQARRAVSDSPGRPGARPPVSSRTPAPPPGGPGG